MQTADIGTMGRCSALDPVDPSTVVPFRRYDTVFEMFHKNPDKSDLSGYRRNLMSQTYSSEFKQPVACEARHALGVPRWRRWFWTLTSKTGR